MTPNRLEFAFVWTRHGGLVAEKTPHRDHMQYIYSGYVNEIERKPEKGTEDEPKYLWIKFSSHAGNYTTNVLESDPHKHGYHKYINYQYVNDEDWERQLCGAAWVGKHNAKQAHLNELAFDFDPVEGTSYFVDDEGTPDMRHFRYTPEGTEIIYTPKQIEDKIKKGEGISRGQSKMCWAFNPTHEMKHLVDLATDVQYGH